MAQFAFIFPAVAHLFQGPASSKRATPSSVQVKQKSIQTPPRASQAALRALVAQFVLHELDRKQITKDGIAAKKANVPTSWLSWFRSAVALKSIVLLAVGAAMAGALVV